MRPSLNVDVDVRGSIIIIIAGGMRMIGGWGSHCMCLCCPPPFGTGIESKGRNDNDPVQYLIAMKR